MHWIESAGGPLVLVPERSLAAWKGADGPSPTGTHYERACAIEDFVGLVPLETGAGVVLGDEPLRTAWRPTTAGGLLVRCIAAPSERDVEAALETLPEGLPWESMLDFHHPGGALLLFDAAFAGSELPDDHLRLDLPAGRWTLDLSAYHPSDDVALMLHRLSPAA